MASGEIAVAQYLLQCSEAALKAGTTATSTSVQGGRAEAEANLSLAWAKLFSKRLALSTKARNAPPGTVQPKLKAIPPGIR